MSPEVSLGLGAAERPTGIPPASPRRILLIRTSALGDIVHTLPVLMALRRHLPQTRIGWVIERAFLPLLEGHRGIDELIPVATRAWGKAPLSPATWRGILAARRRLRAFRPDLVLDLMGNHKAGVLSFLSGARDRLGAARQDRREPSSDLWSGRSVSLKGTHTVDQKLSLLAALGLAPEPADFGPEALLPDAPVAKTPIPPGKPYLVILAGAGWGNKEYPPKAWGEVARRLYRETGLPSLLPSGPAEEPLAGAIAEASSGAAHNLGLLSIPELGSLLRGARLVLGGDTGPLHLAHALGTPVLALLGPTDPERHGPYGAPERALVHRLPCSFCYKRFDEPKACLENLLPARVASRARSLLD